MGRCALDGQLAQRKGSALPVWTPDHLDQELGAGLVAELQQEQGQVVEEEKAVQQTGGVLDNVTVLDLTALLVQPDTIEQPEAQQEDKEKEGEERPEEMDPWKTGAGRAVEDSPGAHCEDQELEGEGDKEPITVHLTLKLRIPGHSLKSMLCH